MKPPSQANMAVVPVTDQMVAAAVAVTGDGRAITKKALEAALSASPLGGGQGSSAEGADTHRATEGAVVVPQHLTAAYDLILKIGRQSHDQDDGGNDYDLDADHDRLQRLIEEAREIMSLPSTSRRDKSPIGSAEQVAAWEDEAEDAGQNLYRAGYRDGYQDAIDPEAQLEPEDVLRGVDSIAIQDGWLAERDGFLSALRHQAPVSTAEGVGEPVGWTWLCRGVRYFNTARPVFHPRDLKDVADLKRAVAVAEEATTANSVGIAAGDEPPPATGEGS